VEEKDLWEKLKGFALIQVLQGRLGRKENMKIERVDVL